MTDEQVKQEGAPDAAQEKIETPAADVKDTSALAADLEVRASETALAKIDAAKPEKKAAKLEKRKQPSSLAIGKGLAFRDHESFQRVTGRAVAGGAAGGLVAHGLAGLAGASDFFPLLVMMTTAGALGLVGARLGGWLRGAQGAALGLIGALLHFACTPQWPWLGALLLGAAAAPILAKGEAAEKMAVTGAVTGLLAFAGLYVANVLQAHGVLTGFMPAPLATAAAGGAAGLFLGLGSAPRHIGPAEEPVESAYLRALDEVNGELQDILQRSLTIYRAIRSDLSQRNGKTEQQLGSRVSDLSMRILRIAEQCRTIEQDLGAAPAKELEDRIEQLQKKAAASTDAAAKKTFQTAIASLDHQRDAVESISRGLERVLARLHANVALLEKVRFSLVHARSADAERFGGEASPLAETIDELSRELDATSMAVGEVFGDRATADEV